MTNKVNEGTKVPQTSLSPKSSLGGPDVKCGQRDKLLTYAECLN